MIVETLERMLAAHCHAAVVEAAEETWPVELWTVLEEAGLPIAWVPERLGGAGASVSDGFAIVRLASRFAAPVPLAETLLAGWVLSEIDLAVSSGPATVVVSGEDGTFAINDDGTLSGDAPEVPHSRHCETLVVVLPVQGSCSVVTVKVADCAIEPGSSLCGESRDRVSCEHTTVQQAAHGHSLQASSVLRMGAALRAAQMAGALESVLSRSLGYAGERQQFGRLIQKFQAVQHNLAELAGEVSAAVAAADTARCAIETHGVGDPRAFLAVACAKIRCGQAATNGAAIAHQVHGAIGFAREYPLHQLTRRLWTWRDDYGSETEWAERLGASICALGADNLWEHLTEL